MSKIIIIFMLLLTSCSSSRVARNYSSSEDIKSCREVVYEITDKFIKIEESKFQEYYEQLNSTLSGNLATVYRSEWKTKESFPSGASFLDSLLKNYGQYNLPENESLSSVEKINAIVSLLKEKRRINAIGMRDPPAPPGSKDRTFTYYTKSIIDGTGAKHQVRLRTYVRTLNPSEMISNTTIKGYFNGSIIEVTKLDSGLYSFVISSEAGEIILREVVPLKILKKYIGNNLSFYSYPHSKYYKLEIKSRPHEEINLPKLQKLMGKHYVQKLSIDIEMDDLKLLFNSSDDIRSSKLRLSILKTNALKIKNNSNERIDAIFKILEDSLDIDADFLTSRGATEYSRHAFEIEVPDMINDKKVRIQTTFDYDMGVRQNYDKNGVLLSPIQSAGSSGLKQSMDEDDKLHIELKVPKVLIEKAQQGDISSELNDLLELFENNNVTNKGKFNYIQKK